MLAAAIASGRLGLLAAAALLTLGAAPIPAIRIERVDPMTVIDDDFARLRVPSLWRGLSAERIVLIEGDTMWRLWRIVNTAKPGGPLWVVPHDNEDGAFAAALRAVRSWGGVMMAVDTDAADGGVSRYNRDTVGARIDPNRHFRDRWPAYARVMLADLDRPRRPIVALHTNTPGFDASLSDCPLGEPGETGEPGGSGAISIRFCSDVYSPSPSRTKGWPFDDDDSLAIIPHLAMDDPRAGFCARALVQADANVMFERVADSDGSLSNYAVERGWRYINLETQDRGDSPSDIVAARDRLVAMIDIVMKRCGDDRSTG